MGGGGQSPKQLFSEWAKNKGGKGGGGFPGSATGSWVISRFLKTVSRLCIPAS